MVHGAVRATFSESPWPTQEKGRRTRLGRGDQRFTYSLRGTIKALENTAQNNLIKSERIRIFCLIGNAEISEKKTTSERMIEAVRRGGERSILK